MSNMSNQCILPTELTVHILCYTTPRDIIRWRTVSKWFRAITLVPKIWKVLYANAPFIRPPGPFPAQSTASLERALVRSTRLAQSWTTQSLRVVSRVEIPFDGVRTGSVDSNDLIGGRWLIVCQSGRRIVLYDTDPDTETHASVPQILWEQEERICEWEKYSVASEEGHVVYVILREEHGRRWRFVEYQLNASESGMLRDTIAIDVPRCCWTFGAQIEGGPSPFFHVHALGSVFDTRTRLFYKFPEFHIALDNTRAKINRRQPGLGEGEPEVILANTHIFVLLPYWRGHWRQEMILIQAFTVPDDDQPLADDRNGILRLSHEGVMFQSTPCVIIRNSIVNPITGSIGVRLLSRWMDLNSDGLHPKCVDVVLHKPSPVDVSPITVRWHAVRRSVHGPPLHLDLDFGYHFFDALGDGHARGLFTKWRHYGADADRDVGESNRSAVVKFAIDATQERCAATLGPFVPLPEEWKHFHCVDARDSHWMCFDGIRGKLFYIRGREMKNQVLVVMDVE